MTATKIKSIGDVPYPIDVGTDALSPLLTAGAALGITGNDADESAWLTRTSDADGVESVRSVHGRTVRWNQHVRDSSNSWAAVGGTISYSDGVVTATPSGGDGFTYCQVSQNTDMIGVGGHKYILSLDFLRENWSDVTQESSYAFPTLFGFWMSARPSLVPSKGVTTWQHLSGIVMFENDRDSSAVAFRCCGDTYPFSIKNVMLIDLTVMFGSGNEPSTIEEFTALYPLSYYEYDAGSLLSVNMEGVETVGFNQLDPAKVAALNNVTENAGVFSGAVTAFHIGMSSGWEGIEYLPNMQYEMSFKIEATASGVNERPYVVYTDGTISDGTVADSSGIAKCISSAGKTVERFSMSYSNTGNISISQPCINLSWSGRRNGEYEPYWQQQRTIPAGTLRSAGSVYDEQTATERIVRVGAVDLGTLTWTESTGTAGSFTSSTISDIKIVANGVKGNLTCAKYDTYSGNAVDSHTGISNGLNAAHAVRVHDATYTGDAAAFKAAMDGVYLFYELATPTTTPIDPPLNLTYRTEQGGTERILVPTGEQSAPPTIVAAQGYTAESLRDAALSAIAPVENGLASTNYGVGSYLVHGGQLCKVTTAIATGEAITIGTNVTTTTVMAEVIALIAQ